jgi:hypothetical protein
LFYFVTSDAPLQFNHSTTIWHVRDTSACTNYSCLILLFSSLSHVHHFVHCFWQYLYYQTLFIRSISGLVSLGVKYRSVCLGLKRSRFETLADALGDHPKVQLPVPTILTFFSLSHISLLYFSYLFHMKQFFRLLPLTCLTSNNCLNALVDSILRLHATENSLKDKDWFL